LIVVFDSGLKILMWCDFKMYR